MENLVAGLSVDELNALRLAAHVALARQDFLHFCTLVDPSYLVPRHIRKVGEYLQKFESGEINRLLILMPPRSGKSYTCTQLFPAWYLARNPRRRVILTAHTATLAESFSVAVRDIIDMGRHFRDAFPEIRISDGQRAAYRWALHGYRDTFIAAGIGGGITGYGATCLIIDDPVKNFEEAVSETVQQRNWDWYVTTARTRLLGRGAVLLVMTHWAEGDLAGRILNSAEGKEFHVLALPAESLGTEEDSDDAYIASLDSFSRKYVFPDVLGRARGEPLWPEMGYTKEFLESAKAVLGYQYQGLYQCSPTVPQGVMFDRGKIEAVTRVSLEGMRCVVRLRSYDLAFSESSKADNTVALRMSLWVSDEKFCVVLEDCQVWRSEWGESAERIIQIAQDDGVEVVMLVEAVASQNLAFKSLRQDPRLARHSIIPVVPDKDKVSRAQYSIRVVGKEVVKVLYSTASSPPVWEEEFLSELASFPYGVRDDRVDAFTQAINYLQPQLDALFGKKFVPPVEEVRPKRKFWVFEDGPSVEGPMIDKLVWRQVIDIVN